MKIKRLKILHILALLIMLNSILSKLAYSQSIGSMFMLQDNFHSQMFNPSYMRDDKAVVIAIPGFAGAGLGNSGSFKITDLIVEDKSGRMVFDIENFYEVGNSESLIKDWSYIPLVYVGIPVENGRISIYLKEQIHSEFGFNIGTLGFLDNGNYPSDYRIYNTDNINYSGIEYRELAVGYAQSINKKINIGIRGKLLFGTVYGKVKNWNYGINTSETGDEVELTSKGSGKLSLPVPVELDIENRILRVIGENALGKYLGSFHNPGLAIDLGATIHFNKKSWISASVNNLGAIWFRHNSMTIEQDASYTFRGFDISNSIDSKIGNGYIDPFSLVLETKDSIRNVYRPVANTARFVVGMIPQTSLHYQHYFSNNFAGGVSNQTAFYKNSVLNIFTISVLQKKGDFSVFENINLYGLNSITVGGGIQWEGRGWQLFAANDNLFAVYHPAKNKSFSMSVGISVLLNKPIKEKSTKGKYTPHLPFFENRN